MGILQFGIIFFLGLFGCQSVQQDLDPSKTFQHDMVVDVNGTVNEGAFVAPEMDVYAIKIQVRGKIDLMVVKTCNREIKIDKPVKSGWFGRNKAMEFEFIPNQREKDSRCMMELAALNEDNKNSFAVMAFSSPKFTLPSRLECNGDSKLFGGTSICQSRAGLRQMVKLPAAVHMGTPKAECETENRPDDTGSWVFPLKKGFCEYVFQEKAAPYKRHRLYAIGYEDFIVKGLEQ